MLFHDTTEDISKYLISRKLLFFGSTFTIYPLLLSNSSPNGEFISLCLWIWLLFLPFGFLALEEYQSSPWLDPHLPVCPVILDFQTTVYNLVKILLKLTCFNCNMCRQHHYHCLSHLSIPWPELSKTVIKKHKQKTQRK